MLLHNSIDHVLQEREEEVLTQHLMEREVEPTQYSTLSDHMEISIGYSTNQ